MDNEKAVYLAIRHFRERGHERIGIITTSLHHRVTPRVERIEGYKKAMFELGLAVRDEYIKGVDLTYIEDTLDFMLSLKEPPTAILAGNDLVLMEILKYVKERKINIPDDLALIGVDDVPFATIFTPKLTTVAQPAFEMGEGLLSCCSLKLITSVAGWLIFIVLNRCLSFGIRRKKSCLVLEAF